MSDATLYGLSYSPWTERAKWALDHHGVPYRFREHTPMLGELPLRLRARPGPHERATVPLLVDASGGLHRSSLDIVLHADRVGRGARLVVDEDAFRALGAVAEVGLAAVRARVTARVLASPEALRESARAVVPAALATLARPVVSAGARYLASKYGADLRRLHESEEKIRTAAAELARWVDTTKPPTPTELRAEHVLLATFLQGVRPPDAPHLRLGPALREAWTFESLARELAPLLRWRDAVYSSARKPGAAQAR